MGGTHFANDMTVLGQIVLAQNLHDIRTVFRRNLNHNTQFFIEQSLECQFFTPCADLLSPIFGIAVFSAAVADAVTFCDQQVHIEGHAHLTRKTHFGHSTEQAAVGSIVVGQHLFLRPQLVNGFDKIDQTLGRFKVGDNIT